MDNKKRESPLHFGCLGNGITVYDTGSTNSSNDYPIVAHISPEGTVSMYSSYTKPVSADDMERINNTAKELRNEFMKEWNKLDTLKQYHRILDQADITTLLNIDNDTSLSTEETVKKYMPYVILREGKRPEPEQHETEIDSNKELDDNFEK